MNDNALVLEGISKAFAGHVAVKELSLQVPRNSIFGLLGPNGAGKTTAVRILATILEPDAGQASVLGLDVIRQAQDVRAIIGFWPDSTPPSTRT